MPEWLSNYLPLVNATLAMALMLFGGWRHDMDIVWCAICWLCFSSGYIAGCFVTHRQYLRTLLGRDE